MTVDVVVDIAKDTLWNIILTSAPVLLISLVVGLIISVFQTATSIQEQTLTFVPKILAIFLALMLLGEWMLNNMSGFMVELWSDFSVYIG
ncbi:MAG: flagellar biosynthesis protein FliQ [Lachnospiraceae bacterium]|nr:flagellar biosynthesis protein FliQ [Lachnospiraceae bacterium]